MLFRSMKPRKKGQRIDKEEIASFQSKISAEENGSGDQDRDTELPEMVKRDLLEEAVSPENTMEQGIAHQPSGSVQKSCMRS